jgi:hypothetical protein
MPAIKRHLCIDVEGVLRWRDSDLKRLFNRRGKEAAGEIRQYLMDKLKDGWRVIPAFCECDNFDKERGCKGHPVEDYKSANGGDTKE